MVSSRLNPHSQVEICLSRARQKDRPDASAIVLPSDSFLSNKGIFRRTYKQSFVGSPVRKRIFHQRHKCFGEIGFAFFWRLGKLEFGHQASAGMVQRPSPNTPMGTGQAYLGLRKTQKTKGYSIDEKSSSAGGFLLAARPCWRVVFSGTDRTIMLQARCLPPSTARL